jgi:hypothetical protein
MDDATLITLVLGTLSGVVGVIGALSSFYAQRVLRQNEADKRLASRLDELRGVLDDAAKALAEALAALPDLHPWRADILENARRVFLRGEENPPWEAAERAISHVEQQAARLQIRLGRNEIVGRYLSAASALRRYVSALDLSGYRDQLTRPRDTDAAVTEWLEHGIDRAVSAVDGATKAQTDFGMAAAELLGAPGVSITLSGETPRR